LVGELGIRVGACDSVEEVVRGADLVVGGTTSSEIMTREQWLKPGSTFIFAGAARARSRRLGAHGQGRESTVGR